MSFPKGSEDRKALVVQCEFTYGLMMEIRQTGDHAALELVPDADYQRFSRLWERAFQNDRLNKKQRAFLNQFEAGVTRVYRGKPYALPPDPAKQGTLFANSPTVAFRTTYIKAYERYLRDQLDKLSESLLTDCEFIQFDRPATGTELAGLLGVGETFDSFEEWSKRMKETKSDVTGVELNELESEVA